ncbi:MAG: peroxiredoxin [Clostridia bacterium]|nr:peroxiredoxin [Clostridia bacterium]
MNEEKQLMLGDELPQMQVSTTDGIKNLPQDYAGKWLILFSHPGDFTPICTTEFVAMSNRVDEFKALGANLLGLSVDGLGPHFKWVEWIEENANTAVPFPIIEDPLGNVAKELGMVHAKKGAKTVRKLFIIDPRGVIRLTMTYPPEIGRSVDEVLRSLNALQMSDKYKMAAPENFPNNLWLGKNVMVYPPPQSNQQIDARLSGMQEGKYECKDWWLCYKEV